jgi:hypothetical protein
MSENSEQAPASGGLDRNLADPPDDNRRPFAMTRTLRTSQAPTGASTMQATEAYASFVKELLDDQNERLAAAEDRGRSVITLSGTMVTLLFAFAAVVTRVQTYQPSQTVIWLLALAAAAFLIAAVAAIGTYAPRRTTALDPDAMRRELWERWGHPDDAPVEKTTATRLALLTAARKLTRTKTAWLLVAVAGQVVAIAILAAAIFTILVTY